MWWLNVRPQFWHSEPVRQRSWARIGLGVDLGQITAPQYANDVVFIVPQMENCRFHVAYAGRVVNKAAISLPGLMAPLI